MMACCGGVAVEGLVVINPPKAIAVDQREQRRPYRNGGRAAGTKRTRLPSASVSADSWDRYALGAADRLVSASPFAP